uniref:Uncharacterized protein n=1 Tax=Meleagris gallopavo TaxID=9103 RepID=A0A803YJW6_MELGA
MLDMNWTNSFVTFFLLVKVAEAFLYGVHRQSVIAAVMFILLCIAAIAICIYRKKNSYSKNEKKGSENEENAESALKSELSIQNKANENQKEYFF